MTTPEDTLRGTQALQEEYYRREGHTPETFRYFYPDGSELTDLEQIARLNRLAVPPAYRDVYLSPDPDAELQAFGRDAAGRLQYRYHPDFLEASAFRKWERLLRFSRQLPQLRQNTLVDLRRSGLPPRKVMALMTRLLYVARFRVGSDAYVRAHKTYGLTTLRKRHVRVDGNTVEFRFRGKHGILQHKLTTDRTLASNIERLLELRGVWLFQGLEENGSICRVRSHDLNAYLREVMGPFTAKDFRTWGGTLLAAEFLAEVGPAASEREAKKHLSACVRCVAEDLGNTPAVVRAHYVSPYIFDQYLRGKVLDDFEPRTSRAIGALEGLSRSEQALARLLEASIREERRKRRKS
ncbi:DNA topoisomerase-1 [Deinobacterium chartae]|uniref:DNA topoisomerase-1 n=1 Tax=Deinobacterium chartae TaxID=521158 RepID=A0A841HW83_9DEIO|nr:DNA topoisomerase IB [Deinobacterium chartae]MBB6096914.1 DNA topoisomerase-1 [Deinobacterium chartae]